ncbi:MAG TPA: DUF790 family protein [Myxococcales bacterium]
MLTGDQSIVRYEEGRAYPNRLTQRAHGHYLGHAERMLAIYRSGPGKTRGELHRAVERLLEDEPECPPRRVESFCKLLDEVSDFHSDPRGAAALRLKVFSMAAPQHPLVSGRDGLFDKTESEVKESIASELGKPWPEIERELYSDVIDQHRLVSFAGYPAAAALLSRYNVAQVQACLYRANRVVVHAHADLKTILRHAKLARLLHTIVRRGPSDHRIELTGPASVLSQTRRYGVDFAAFLTALLACRDWEMTAHLTAPWGQPVRLELSSKDGLKSPLPPPEEFDSSIEEGFAKKFGEVRDGWTLERESEVLHEGQTAFVPDFVLRHEDGTEVLLEIVGFWTPEYLAAKRATLQRFRDRRILVAVAEANVKEGAAIPEGFLTYKTALKLEPVLAALQRLRAGAGAIKP